MQYWILYQPGVGGDGFGCMLEHADNIKPADGQLEWRFHYYDGRYGFLDRPIRFYQASWASQPLPFRSSKLPTSTELNPAYVDLVEQQQNTVITAHLNFYWDQVDQFEYSSVVKKDQIKIHLYSDRSKRVCQDFVTKRHIPTPIDWHEIYHQRVNNQELARKEYNIHINIEQAWRDWDYMQACMSQLNINLSKEVYDQYLTYIDNLSKDQE